MYRYAGENKTSAQLNNNAEQMFKRVKRAKLERKFYPDNIKKWAKISADFDAQLAKYGEVDKDLIF